MVILGLLLVFLPASMAGATTYDFSAGSLGDLKHGYYYTWGLNWSVPEGETIVGASLFFDDIRNNDGSSNDLYVHLLDNVNLGVDRGYDGYSAGSYSDRFAGQGILLEHYEDLTDWPPQDITYSFSDTDLSTLMAYAADGNFGFGIDPDCIFYQNGVSFSIETAATPIPAPILLLGTGLIGMAGFRRKFKGDK